MKSNVNGIWIALLALMLIPTMAAANNIVVNGDLESMNPAFWHQHEMGGDLIWDWTEAYMGEHSLKIDKPNAGGSATWRSANNAKLYWNNMDAVFYTMSVWFKTENVPVNPANDGLRVAVSIVFEDIDGNSIANVPIYADQTAGTMDWHEVTADVLLTAEPYNCTIYFWMGGDATGTAWIDMVNVSSDPWTAGIFNGNFEEPEGWMAWASEGDVGYAALVDYDDAYSGDYCVKLMENDDLGDEMVFYSKPFPVDSNEWYIISVMVKTEDMNVDPLFYPTSQIGENITNRANLCFFYHTGNYATDWALTGGDQFVYFDQRTAMSDGWVMYWCISQAPPEASAISVRARFNPTVMGTAYYDNFSVAPVSPQNGNLVVNGDMESGNPAFWNQHETGGDLIWDWTEGYMGERSLKIDKPNTGGSATWRSDNNAKLFWNNMDAVFYTMSVWFKTENVPANPDNDGLRVAASFVFEDIDGNSIANVPIYADQTAGTMDWHEVTADVLLTAEPYNCTIYLWMGGDATGTAWFDMVNVSSDPWTAGIFNANFEEPEGWMSWASEGDVGYANLEDVGDMAYSGTQVVHLLEQDDLGDEMVYYSGPAEVMADTYYLFEVMVKTNNIGPTNDMLWPTAVMGDNISDRANLCYFFHAGDIWADWALTGGDKFVYFDQRAATTDDYVAYRAVSMSPADATGASLRARFNPTVQGDIYYDDFKIFELAELTVGVDDGDSPFAVGQGALPNTTVLAQNYPNPFNAQSIIEFTLPHAGQVQVEIYDVLGRRIARLLDSKLTAGTHQVAFNADEIGMTASGVYFYRLNTPDGALIKKMTYMK